MDLNHLHIAVSDLDRSKRFYETYLGFKERTYHGTTAFLSNSEGFDLALDPDYVPERLPKWFHMGVRLKSPDQVKVLFGMFENGSEHILRKLEEYPDHVFFHVVDPDGYKIEIYWDQ